MSQSRKPKAESLLRNFHFADDKPATTLALTGWRALDYDRDVLPIPDPFRTTAVAAWWVLEAMTRLHPPNTPPVAATYGETSIAIAEAATNDPLFDDEDGGYKTAALLLALADHESNFHPNAVGHGGGLSLGLFQIQPPTAQVSANLLLLPRDAAPIAVRLIKKSLHLCRHRPVDERLAWYAQGRGACVNEEPSREALQDSRVVFHRAMWVLLTVLPPGRTREDLLWKKQ